MSGVLIVFATALSACGFDDSLYFGWDDRRVICARSIDDSERSVDVPGLLQRMDDAITYRQVYNLYSHVPGMTVSYDLIDQVLDGAVARQLSFVTYGDMLDASDPRGGLALAFDDQSVDAWFTLRDTLRRHGARVTFFVTRYLQLPDQARAELRELAADGHDIEAHGVDHLDAVKYVAAHGMEAYLRDEALPSVDALVADGYPASVFAYPFGSHDEDIDRALLDHVALVRTTAGPCPW